MNTLGTQSTHTIASFEMTWKYLQTNMKAHLQQGRYSKALEVEKLMSRLQHLKEDYERTTE